MAAKTRVLVVPKAESTPYWRAVRQGGLDAAAKRNAEIIFRGSLRQEESRVQRAIIEEEMRNGIDAIVVAPAHTSHLTDILALARQSGIAVVAIDSSMDEWVLDSFIATDNREAGHRAADFLLDRLNGPGSLLLLRYSKDNGSTQEREAGFASAVRKHAPDRELIVSDFIGISIGNVFHRTRELLREHPDVRAVFAPSEGITIGCIKALRDLGLAGKVKVVGFDDTPESRRALQDGDLVGLMVQQPYRMGYLGVLTACDVLAGKKVRKHIVSKARLITDISELGPVLK